MNKKLLLYGLVATTAINAKLVIIKTEDEYKKHVVDNNDPVIVKFSADWCSVCNNVANPFKDVANEPEFSHVTFAQIDVDELDNVSKQNAIVGVPTFVFRNNGTKTMEEVGVQNMPDFKNHLRESLKTAFKSGAKKSADSVVAQPANVTEQVEAVAVAVTPEEAQPNAIAQVLQSIVAFFMMIITKVKNLFMVIIDAIKGFFGN